MSLTISEEIVLLGMDDDKGTLVLNASPSFPVCVASAIILDLAIGNHIQFENSKITKVQQPDLSHLSKAYNMLDNVLDIDMAIKKLALQDFQPLEEVVDRLTSQNILSKTTKKVLFIKKEMFPTENPEPENVTRYLLHKLVFEEGNLDTKMYYLLFLVKAGNLVGEVFGSKKKAALDSIENILKTQKEAILNQADEEIFNSLVVSMQKKMMVAV